MLLTDSSGNLVEQYEYDAFGQPYFFDTSGQSRTSSGYGNRFLFTGREYLSDLKLYDFRNRMYQPEIGRFMQPDPKEFAAGDYNLYRYCHNDPVNRSDPTGLQDEKPKLVREVLKLTRTPTGSHIPYTIRYTESGNWLNTRIADHYKPGLEKSTGNAGQTDAKGTAKQSGNDWNLDLHVDWFVDSNHRDSTVVTRELDHVQDFRDFSASFARSLSGNISLSAFPQKVLDIQEESIKKYDGTKAEKLIQGAELDKPHNLSKYKKEQAILPEFEDTASKVPYHPATSDPPY